MPAPLPCSLSRAGRRPRELWRKQEQRRCTFPTENGGKWPPAERACCTAPGASQPGSAWPQLLGPTVAQKQQCDGHALRSHLRVSERTRREWANGPWGQLVVATCVYRWLSIFGAWTQQSLCGHVNLFYYSWLPTAFPASLINNKIQTHLLGITKISGTWTWPWGKSEWNQNQLRWIFHYFIGWSFNY